jgi:hypothetical protein
MSTTENTHIMLQKCNKCHIEKEHPEFYRERRGTLLYKTCNTCINTPMIKCKHCKASRLIKDFQRNGKTCKLCNMCVKKSLCTHNRQKVVCRDCNGSQICEHNRQKGYCKDCKGSQICEHNKRRQFCALCGGSQICEHSIQKSRCKICEGSEICEHKKKRYDCRECGGKGICEHNKIKTSCKDCIGSQICIHKNYKNTCRECGGKGICEHSRKRSECKDCKGGSICQHINIKSKCTECHPEKSCQNCFSIYVKTNSKYAPNCFRCFCVLNPDVEIPRRYKLKEHYLQETLKEEFKDIDLIFDKIIKGDCSSRRRPDVRIECFTHNIIVECDEDQHKNYECENKRTMQLFEDLGNRPIVLIRFNPDKYDDNASCFKYTKDGTVSVNKKEWKKRIEGLKNKIKEYLDVIPEKEVSVEYMYYDI